MIASERVRLFLLSLIRTSIAVFRSKSVASLAEIAIRTAGSSCSNADRADTEKAPFDPVVPNVANAFFAEVLRGIDDELVAHGYGMIIGNLDNLIEREPRYVELVFAGQVDGVLLLSGRVPAGNGRLMSEAGVPMATLCVSIPGTGLPHVVVDDQAAAEAVAAHVERGIIDPWQALAAHRPLGEVQRLRKVVYFESQKARGAG